jgi:hypothetical protein
MIMQSLAFVHRNGKNGVVETYLPQVNKHLFQSDKVMVDNHDSIIHEVEFLRPKLDVSH